MNDQPKRWEYAVVRISADCGGACAELDSMGSDGWELVSVNVDDGRTVAYLKREVSK